MAQAIRGWPGSAYGPEQAVTILWLKTAREFHLLNITIFLLNITIAIVVIHDYMSSYVTVISLIVRAPI